MKKRGILTLLMAATLLVAPPVLESAGIDLPVMTVSATSNNTSGSGNTSRPGTSGTTNRPSASGNNTQKPGGNTSTNTNRPSASGNNSYGSGNTSNSSQSLPASAIAVSGNATAAVSVTTSAQDIAKAAGLANGESVAATVNFTDNAAAKALIENVAAGINAKLGYVVDISLYVNGSADRKITELKTPIKIVLTLPGDLDGTQYDFAVVRVHNGATTVLYDQDTNPSTITITSDRFSEYGVIYAPKGQLKGVKDSVPKTGDPIPAAVPVAATTCLAAAAATAVALNRKKRV